MEESRAKEIMKEFLGTALAPGNGPDSIWLYREALNIINDALSSGKISFSPRHPLFRWNQDLHLAELVLRERLERIKKTRDALKKAFEVALDMLVKATFGGIA